MNGFIKQLVILLTGFVFTVIIGKYPNFPIDQQTLINFVLWILATFFGINSALVGFNQSVNDLTKRK